MDDRKKLELILKSKYLQCYNCKQQYDDEVHLPRVLSCKHVACSYCIYNQNESSADCQKCGVVCVFDPNSDVKLPVDNRVKILKNVLESLLKGEEGSDSASGQQQLCEFCNESAQEYYCKECKSGMCESCKSQLHIGKTFRKHKVSRVQSSSSGTDTVDGGSSSTCSIPGHGEGQLDLFCSECKYLICSKCSTSHDDPALHRVVNVQQAHNEMRNDMLDKLSDLKSSTEDDLGTKEDIDNACSLLSFVLSENDVHTFLKFGPACLSVAEDVELSLDLNAFSELDKLAEDIGVRKRTTENKSEQEVSDVKPAFQTREEQKTETDKPKPVERKEGRPVWKWIIIAVSAMVFLNIVQRIVNLF